MFTGVLGMSILFPCCTFSMLHFFHVALFLILNKYLKWTKDRKLNQKTTIHSAPSTCFTFVLIFYNTFFQLYNLEGLIKWKRAILLFCWKIICFQGWKLLKVGCKLKFISPKHVAKGLGGGRTLPPHPAQPS